MCTEKISEHYKIYFDKTIKQFVVKITQKHPHKFFSTFYYLQLHRLSNISHPISINCDLFAFNALSQFVAPGKTSE